MTQRPYFFPLQGGLDLVSPALSMQPGKARACLNHEPDQRGYRRIDGYERFDGRPKPSEASYVVLSFSAGAHAPDVGKSLIGATSGAVAAVMSVTVSSGSWGSGTAAGTIIARVTSGAFTDGEDIQTQDVLAFSSGFSSGFE